jgi:hypothetical protein
MSISDGAFDAKRGGRSASFVNDVGLLLAVLSAKRARRSLGRAWTGSSATWLLSNGDDPGAAIDPAINIIACGILML